MAPPTAPPLAPRLRRAAGTLLRVLAWMAACLFTLLLLAWLAMQWAILPHIERWRPQIEAQASEAVGIPVRIGSIAVRSGGWVPVVELHDVVLLDAQLRPALQLARVVASVSPRSLLASLSSRELRLAQLLIDGAQLEVRRDTAGRVFVAGLEFSDPAPGDDSSAADWLLKQRELAIRGATLRWTDEQRGAPTLALDNVDLVLRNTLRRHALRLDATPPAAWGERFSLRGDFTQPLLARSSDWRRWSGQAYVDAPRADASHLRQYVDLPFELSQGVGAVRGWLDLREGVASGITLDVALRQVSLRLEPGLEPLMVAEVQGRLAARQRPNGGSVSLHQFGFLAGDGVRWPPGDLELAWTRGADGGIAGGEFKAGRLDLALVAHTATRLPLGQTVRTLLDECRPQGIASDVHASWSGPLDALTHYRVAATLSALSIDARPAALAGEVGRPGLRNVDIGLEATEKGGQATLAMKAGALDLPGMFAEPLVPLDSFTGTLRWTVEPKAGAKPGIQVQLLDARLANADAQAELHATWKTGAGPGQARGGRLPGVLELDGTLSRGIAARFARYLPLGLPEAKRRYVERAVRGGTVKQASFHINGDLWDFPFHAGQPGEFRAAITIDDVTLAYAPDDPAPAAGAGAPTWPPMTALSGDLNIDRETIEFRNARAQIYGVELTALQGGYRLGAPSVLTLNTLARGPVADLLRFVNATPVGGWIDGSLRETTASGSGELKVGLSLPLGAPGQGSVNGSLQLAGSDLRLRRELPLFAGARGQIDFTDKGLTTAQLSGRVLGGEVTIDGGSQPDGSLRFNAQGSASVEALRQTPELGPLATLAGALSGQTTYRLTVGLVQGAPEIDLSSDLVGLASELPAPLTKSAQTALPLHFKTSLGPGPAALETLRLDIGALVHAQYQRDLTGPAPRVLRGGIGIFEPAPTPTNGVAAAISLPSLDLDAWNAAVDRLFGAAAGGGGGAAAPAGYAPTQIGLKVQELTVFGRRLSQVSAGLSQLDGQWRANVNADQLEGYLEYRPPGGTNAPAGRVYARLARLNLPRSEADEVSELLDRQPLSVPALDLVVDDFELRGRRLGRLEVVAVNKPAPAREWTLDRLNLTVPEAQLNASGSWAAVAGTDAARPPGTAPNRQAAMKFQLDINDSGALLTRLGMPGAIRGGKGQLKGDLGWLGSPLSPDVPSMAGQFLVAVEAGQFLQAPTGAARLLSVLSLQALARRFTLDFRDLSQEGFAFDSVKGEVAIARGVASTENLVMRGVQAVVLLAGSADIGRETQDLRVVVVPEINAGAASLAVAVINPAIGLGTFLAQMFLRDPIAQAGTREFHISGTWADPQIEPVTRSVGQALPPIPPAAASSAASSAER